MFQNTDYHRFGNKKLKLLQGDISMLNGGMVTCGMVTCGIVSCGVVICGMVTCGMVICGMVIFIKIGTTTLGTTKGPNHNCLNKKISHWGQLNFKII